MLWQSAGSTTHLINMRKLLYAKYSKQELFIITNTQETGTRRLFASSFRSSQ